MSLHNWDTYAKTPPPKASQTISIFFIIYYDIIKDKIKRMESQGRYPQVYSYSHFSITNEYKKTETD